MSNVIQTNPIGAEKPTCSVNTIKVLDRIIFALINEEIRTKFTKPTFKLVKGNNGVNHPKDFIHP